MVVGASAYISLFPPCAVVGGSYSIHAAKASPGTCLAARATGSAPITSARPPTFDHGATSDETNTICGQSWP